jgi:hypothetical protein
MMNEMETVYLIAPAQKTRYHTKCREPGFILPVDGRQKRICRVCGREQWRDRRGNGYRCLYCHGNLYPTTYHSHKRHAFVFPCPNILWHHRSDGECLTCNGTNQITLWGVGASGANRVFERMVKFSMHRHLRGNILMLFGESQ